MVAMELQNRGTKIMQITKTTTIEELKATLLLLDKQDLKSIEKYGKICTYDKKLRTRLNNAISKRQLD